LLLKKLIIIIIIIGEKISKKQKKWLTINYLSSPITLLLSWNVLNWLILWFL
jgi:hypothetical protein